MTLGAPLGAWGGVSHAGVESLKERPILGRGRSCWPAAFVGPSQNRKRLEMASPSRASLTVSPAVIRFIFMTGSSVGSLRDRIRRRFYSDRGLQSSAGYIEV